jgi:hypothetical protein
VTELEEVWRCARAVNMRPVSACNARSWWCRTGDLELIYSPLTNDAQAFALIERFYLDVQWAGRHKVRTRFHEQSWDSDWRETLRGAAVSRVAGKFKDLPFRS